MAATATPFALLLDLARRSRQHAAELPAQDEVIELWNGIGFSIAGNHYVAPMGEVTEILHVPRYTQIPGVKSWIYGVANVRGRLMPVLDLPMFFGLSSNARTLRERRVLLLQRDDIFTGLLVDEVHGMQYFPVDSFSESVTEAPTSIAPFLRGEYRRDRERWMVFSAAELSQDANFLNVSDW